MACLMLSASCQPGSSGEEAADARVPAWGDRIDRLVGGAVSPGTLARAHAHLSGVAACTECHASLRGTPDGLCLDCHEDIGRRMQEQVGVHGAFEGACAACHLEHRGRDADLLGLDRQAFNHERAVFVLRGAHREVDCEDCHRRADPETGREAFRAQGIDFDRCASCHRDVHGDDFLAARDCAVCHEESGWAVPSDAPTADGAEPGFRHDVDAGFPLSGRHAGVPCRSCHTEARRVEEKSRTLAPGSGAPAECGSCHDDVHRGALGSACARCHTPAAWQGPAAVFDHARHTDFVLDRRHATLDCKSCHLDERFQARATDCAGCHPDATALLAGRFDGRTGEADPHRGRVECQRCHPADAPGTRLVDYGRSCLDCHTSSYAALLTTRKSRLDELVVASEAMLRRAELAARRGEASPAAPVQPTRERLERLARTGAHNPVLAERLLREELTRLESLQTGRATGARP